MLGTFGKEEEEDQPFFNNRILLGEAWCEAVFDPNDPFALTEAEEQEVLELRRLQFGQQEEGAAIDTFLVRVLPESCVS